MINSEEFNGMESEKAKDEMPEVFESRGIGKKTTNYKLRDWVFSRQRYWESQSLLFTVTIVVQ